MGFWIMSWMKQTLYPAHWEQSMRSIAMIMAMVGSMCGFGTAFKFNHNQSKDYSAVNATSAGEYYEWQKMSNIDLRIRRVWRAQNDWQMLTKTKEEQMMLTTKDGPREQIDVPSILQEALESSSSDEKQQSAKRIVEMSRAHDAQLFRQSTEISISTEKHSSIRCPGTFPSVNRRNSAST